MWGLSADVRTVVAFSPSRSACVADSRRKKTDRNPELSPIQFGNHGRSFITVAFGRRRSNPPASVFCTPWPFSRPISRHLGLGRATPVLEPLTPEDRPEAPEAPDM